MLLFAFLPFLAASMNKLVRSNASIWTMCPFDSSKYIGVDGSVLDFNDLSHKPSSKVFDKGDSSEEGSGADGLAHIKVPKDKIQSSAHSLRIVSFKKTKPFRRRKLRGSEKQQPSSYSPRIHKLKLSPKSDTEPSRLDDPPKEEQFPNTP